MKFQNTSMQAPILLFLLTFGTLSSCQQGEKPGDKTDQLLIGFSLDSLVVERWERDVEGFESALTDLDAEMTLVVADQDAKKQEAQIRGLIKSGIDALVIVPNDAEALSAVVRDAKRQGIPVISYDRLVRNAGVDLYISFDNKKVGSLMAETLIKHVPQGRYVIINGAKSDNNAQLLNDGVMEVLNRYTPSGRISLVGEIWPSSWDSEEVRRSFEALLDTQGDIDAIIAGNDMLAEVAIGVLSERRLASRVKVVGQDGDLAACQRIAEGTQLATIYKPIDRLALTGAGFAVMLARGEHPGAPSSMFDGQYDVPYIKLEPVLVTNETLQDTVIRDGFHTLEDVYRNIKENP